MMLGLVNPLGSLRCDGIDNDVLRRMLSIFLWRFQNSPFKSWSFSSGSGRCRWIRFRPNRHAIKTTPPKAESLDAPAGLIDSASDNVRSGLLISKASSEAGRSVRMSFSSIVIGQPVPILAYRSSQNAIQKVLLLSSRSVQSRGGGRHILTSSPAPSSL